MGWRRVALAVLDSNVGFNVVGGLLALLVVGLPALLFGWMGFAAMALVTIGWIAGYEWTYRTWRKRGFVPRL